MKWEQKRPDWCLHSDCEYVASAQAMICKGKLTKPMPHGESFNTHRFCLNTKETRQRVFDLQINKTDIYQICRILQK